MPDDKLAVLIDADNVPYAYVKEMLEEISRSGTPTIKRIYADWTKPNANGWKAILLENAITPVQQYGYTTGKNATDSAMIIDAMDVLYAGKVDGFCLVSSDSDFTRLAIRLREAGMLVIGMGEKKTPRPFIAACNKFIYIEVLREPTASKVLSLAPASKPAPLKVVDAEIAELLRQSAADLADENGWTFLAALGTLLLKRKPDFDSRNYGFPKLLPLVRETGLFEIDERSLENAPGKHIYLRQR
ncbi:MAG: NYN domain-containing protein [Hymenobacter sp.]|nr:MAG: NYN domain-containing protein [Hymenobacter sp.]